MKMYHRMCLEQSSESEEMTFEKKEKTKGTYPTGLEMSLVMKTLLCVSQSLKLFLSTLFTGDERISKLFPLARALMQVIRPIVLQFSSYVYVLCLIKEGFC